MTIGSSVATRRPNSLLNGPCRPGKCCCRTISLSEWMVGSVTAAATAHVVTGDDPNPIWRRRWSGSAQLYQHEVPIHGKDRGQLITDLTLRHGPQLLVLHMSGSGNRYAMATVDHDGRLQQLTSQRGKGKGVVGYSSPEVIRWPPLRVVVHETRKQSNNLTDLQDNLNVD
jgi:hypothetical protein